MDEKQFPNGFASWQETHYEVVAAILFDDRHNPEHSAVSVIMERAGTGGLYELAEKLTDEFEKINEGKEWDGDFFDEIDAFMEEKLNNIKDARNKNFRGKQINC